jgi:hypothetical protein
LLTHKFEISAVSLCSFPGGGLERNGGASCCGLGTSCGGGLGIVVGGRHASEGGDVVLAAAPLSWCPVGLLGGAASTFLVQRLDR